MHVMNGKSSEGYKNMGEGDEGKGGKGGGGVREKGAEVLHLIQKVASYLILAVSNIVQT